jgi:hypothetical protein
MNLHELAAEYRALQEAVIEAGGELSQDMDQRLSHVEESIHRKVDALRVLIVENEAEHEKLSREAQYFQRRALTHKRAVESYRHWIMSAMEAAGLQRAGERFPLRIQANGGRPEFLWTDDACKVPDEYIRTRVELDKDAIFRAYQRGDLDGRFDVIRGKHLREV